MTEEGARTTEQTCNREPTTRATHVGEVWSELTSSRPTTSIVLLGHSVSSTTVDKPTPLGYKRASPSGLSALPRTKQYRVNPITLLGVPLERRNNWASWQSHMSGASAYADLDFALPTTPPSSRLSLSSVATDMCDSSVDAVLPQEIPRARWANHGWRATRTMSEALSEADIEGLDNYYFCGLDRQANLTRAVPWGTTDRQVACPLDSADFVMSGDQDEDSSAYGGYETDDALDVKRRLVEMYNLRFGLLHTYLAEGLVARSHEPRTEATSASGTQTKGGIRCIRVSLCRSCNRMHAAHTFCDDYAAAPTRTDEVFVHTFYARLVGLVQDAGTGAGVYVAAPGAKSKSKKKFGYGESNPELPRPIVCTRMRGGNVSRLTLNSREERLLKVYVKIHIEELRGVGVETLPLPGVSLTAPTMILNPQESVYPVDIATIESLVVSGSNEALTSLLRMRARSPVGIVRPSNIGGGWQDWLAVFGSRRAQQGFDICEQPDVTAGDELVVDQAPAPSSLVN
ncbi:hypothetical protein BDZ89DRAFT_1039482 [Hymenopellis radicata]|nr:hypothetical protein BDZ89DRAFT_1039482 [Hymenopellis radicata]